MPTSTETPPNPQSLTFPPAVFAALQPTLYLLAHLQPTSPSTTSLRANGRTPSTFRAPLINTGSLTHASGSAVVRCGDTAVVCGVRAEILDSRDIAQHPPSTVLQPDSIPPGDTDTASARARQKQETATISTLSLLVPNLDLATGCHPSFLPNSPPTPLAQSLSQRILSLLHSTALIPLSSLLITYKPPRETFDPLDEEPDEVPKEEVKGYWVLYIDIVFISLDGNAFDAAWGAVMGALRDTVLPRAWWDADREGILCSPERGEARGLGLRRMPVACAFAVFSPRQGQGKEERAWVLADPDAFEEGLCEEMVTVVVDGDEGRGGGGISREGSGISVLRIEKSGGAVVGREELREIVGLAQGRWQEWSEVLQRPQR